MTKPKTAAPANRLGPADADRSRRSVAKGDTPDAVLDRYLIERDRRGRPERFFRDHRAAEPIFRDRGGSLVSTQAYPDAIADMLKIARHRGWSQIRVAGDVAFRREVWIQAQAMGLEVRGHRPRERDRPDVDRMAGRLARAAVVVARLIPDGAVQARLMQAAWAKAERLRPKTREPSRGRDRSR